MDSLIEKIEAFLEQQGLSEWQFGLAVLRDKNLLRQLRAGRDLRMSTVERIERFMSEYPMAIEQVATLEPVDPWSPRASHGAW